MSPIIPVSKLKCQVKSWKNYLRDAVSDPLTLLSQLDLTPRQLKIKLDMKNTFNMRVPQPFIDKMRPGDANDPLLMQVISQTAENLEIAGFSRDPLQESQANTPGLLYKYQGRVLLVLASTCAVNCRYCFRRHFPYQDKVASGPQLDASIKFIENTPSIHEVILSGGDPLIVSDYHLSQLVNRLEQIAHVKRLRIHTRLPVVIPQRITPDICTLLKKSRLQSSIVLHINHPNEIDPLLANYLARLTHAGVQLLNQSVLLNNINDDLNTLCQLSEKLFATGILPYYLHQLDKVTGAAHFEVSEEEAIRLIREMRNSLPGYLVPRLAKEEAGKRSKTVVA